MEQESFKNKEIGKILNDNFVCIKVDREERPDVDKVYMTFVQVRRWVCHGITTRKGACVTRVVERTSLPPWVRHTL